MMSPHTSQPRIRSAHPGDADALAGLITTAFFDLPPAEWLVPDHHQRREILERYFAIFVDHGLTTGQVDVTCDHTGQPVAAAIWWPGHDPGPPDYEHRRDTIAGAHQPRFAAFDELMGQAHPTQPHRYLGFAATSPDLHGHGLASALLAHRHTELDRTSTPAYLEASTARVCRLYRRHGYTPTGFPITLPGGPPMWPMWRPPTERA